MLIMVAAIVPGLLQALGLGVAGGANTARGKVIVIL